jgi:futalosine hydrolase
MAPSAKRENKGLADIAGGRPLVLLTATEMEAEPLLSAMWDQHRFEVATKRVYLGKLDVGVPSYQRTGQHHDQPSDQAAIPAILAIGGCDKTNTAHILTCLLQAMQPVPRLVLQVGIAGAFPGAEDKTIGTYAFRGPGIGDIIVATQEAYADTGSSGPEGWLSATELGLSIANVDGAETGGVFTLDRDLVDSTKGAIENAEWPGAPPGVHAGPCVTSSRVTGLRSEADALRLRWAALAESMEGAAGAHICALYGIPFLEIRGISNLVGDRDRTAWRVDRAVAVAGKAALAAVAALAGRLGEIEVDEGKQRPGDGHRV